MLPRQTQVSPLEHFRTCFQPVKGLVRFVVDHVSEVNYVCGLMRVTSNSPEDVVPCIPEVFTLRRRRYANTTTFNAVMVVPTGIGAAVGGHAGDASPAARLLGGVCDTLVLHPNVVNGSDINEMPDNALYVEGSMLTRLLMGTIGLRPVRRNRILLVIDGDLPKEAVSAALNAASAARACLGAEVEVFSLHGGDRQTKLLAGVRHGGRATGRVVHLEYLLAALGQVHKPYDAIALASPVALPGTNVETVRAYFENGGVNPWGGIEAMLTHTVSAVLRKPVAHAPMVSDMEEWSMSVGQVDPRMAAEAVSLAYLHCVLKGLHRSPKILTTIEDCLDDSVFTVEDISALVIPDRCYGLPLLAAVEQGIPVIAVRDKENVLRNDLRLDFPDESQLRFADSYVEAAGMLQAMKAGVSLESVRRPLPATKVVSEGDKG